MQLCNDKYTYINEKWERDKCLGITLQVKHKDELIVKLKAIKSKEDIFCYLFFYLHCSFF